MRILLDFFEAVKNEDLPEIYCDLDEVLVDFIKAADKAVDGDFVSTEKEKRWTAINQTKGFWANLDWKPNAQRLYKFISRYDPHILSAYTGRDPTSKVGKLKWLKKNANFKKGNIHLVMRSQKKSYAKTDGNPNVLIDDYDKNISEWEKSGGIGILHTNVGKTIGELKRLGFK